MGRADGVPAAPDLLDIEVAYCPQPGQDDRVTLRLPVGSTVADALQASGLLRRHALTLAGLKLGVWCRPRDPASVLRDCDRVEIYRPLTVDPKESRRLRYKRHREKLDGAKGGLPGRGQGKGSHGT